MIPTLVSLLILAAESPSEPPAETAEALVHRSVVEYDLGQFEKALKDVTRAYEIDARPELLFNLGQCHRALGHWQQAEFFYRGFLRQRPDTEARPKVEKLIARMVAKQEEEAASAPKPEPPLVPVPAAPVPEAAPPTAPPTPEPVASPVGPARPGITLALGGGVTTGIVPTLGPPVSVALRVEAGLHPFWGPYLALDAQTGAATTLRETAGLLLVGYRFGLSLKSFEVFAAPALGGGFVGQSNGGSSWLGAAAAELGVAYEFDGRLAVAIEGQFPVELLQKQEINGTTGVTTSVTTPVFVPAGWVVLRWTPG